MSFKISFFSHSPQLLQLFLRMAQRCFAVKLQNSADLSTLTSASKLYPSSDPISTSLLTSIPISISVSSLNLILTPHFWKSSQAQLLTLGTSIIAPSDLSSQ